MSGPTLSIIVPTAGRPTLARTLDSFAGQLLPGDECIVVGDTFDGPLPETEAICRDYPFVRYVEHASSAHFFGHPQYEYGQELAKGAWLFGQDDDDIFTPDAFDAIRSAIAALPAPCPLLFRFRSYWGMTFWDTPGLLAQARIGGHCLVQPNVPGKVGQRNVEGRYRYESDYDWIIDTVARWHPVPPVWVDAVISVARPA